MNQLDEKFQKLGVDNAPGQEVRRKDDACGLRGEKIAGRAVDFSHGDVDAHEPIPGSRELFDEAYRMGGCQAYTEYRGSLNIREYLAAKVSAFTGKKVDAENLIIAPGTQGALFLAMGSLVGRGDKVAIVEPDYFANRKIVEFFDGVLSPVTMDYLNVRDRAGLDLTSLEKSFKDGAKVFLFSNPNNPTGVIYSADEIKEIARLAQQYHVTVIADQLYSRQIFDGRRYTHLCNENIDSENIVTVMGPSKTESLSGFRLGIAFGAPRIISRMEKLQAIVSLRAAGYNQAVAKNWFSEPDGWMEKRVSDHQEIRDALLKKLAAIPGIEARPTEGGSYLFVKLPPLEVSIGEFVKALRLLADVTVTPGTEFGPQFTDSFRINFSQDKKAACDAIERIGAVAERYRK